MDEATPYDQSYFKHIAEWSRTSAAAIWDRILPLVGPFTSCLDVGCGRGDFLAALATRGVADIVGVDGDYVDRTQLQISVEQFVPHDLKSPLELSRTFDLVLSVEVAEHIPAVAADIFVDSLVGHGDLVMFSAAAAGQSGVSHVNCQWPAYWKAKFAARGYTCFDVLRPIIWDVDEISYWYRQNLMLFARRAAATRLQALQLTEMPILNVVHPESFRYEMAVKPKVGELLHEFPSALMRSIRWRFVKQDL